MLRNKVIDTDKAQLTLYMNTTLLNNVGSGNKWTL